MLADDPLPAEFLELIEAGPVVEILSFLLDGAGRANLNTFLAFAAVALKGPVRLKGHVGEHRDQPEPRPVLRMDKEVAPAHPPQPGQVAHFLVGEMRFLVLPVEHLGGRDGKGSMAALLDMGCKKEGCPVEEEIELAVVVKIEGSRPVLYLLEHTADEPFSHRYSSVETIPDLFIQEEFIPDSGDVRHAEQGGPEVQGEPPEAFGVLLFCAHEIPFY